MYLDIYAIQNVPPCDINRDDTGTPKTAIYGGYLRSRVSSQAWKHAMREEFAQTLDPEGLGVRTKHAVGLIADEIKTQRPDLADEAEGLASAVLQVTGVKIEKSKRTGSEEGSAVSQYLIFIARSEVAKLARIAIDAHEAGRTSRSPRRS
jgi:CRISPR system Cascade subunit CasC